VPPLVPRPPITPSRPQTALRASAAQSPITGRLCGWTHRRALCRLGSARPCPQPTRAPIAAGRPTQPSVSAPPRAVASSSIADRPGGAAQRRGDRPDGHPPGRTCVARPNSRCTAARRTVPGKGHQSSPAERRGRPGEGHTRPNPTTRSSNGTLAPAELLGYSSARAKSNGRSCSGVGESPPGQPAPSRMICVHAGNAPGGEVRLAPPGGSRRTSGLPRKGVASLAPGGEADLAPKRASGDPGTNYLPYSIALARPGWLLTGRGDKRFGGAVSKG